MTAMSTAGDSPIQEWNGHCVRSRYASAVFEALGRAEFLRFLGEYAAARGLYDHVRQQRSSLRTSMLIHRAKAGGMMPL